MKSVFHRENPFALLDFSSASRYYVGEDFSLFFIPYFGISSPFRHCEATCGRGNPGKRLDTSGLLRFARNDKHGGMEYIKKRKLTNNFGE